MDVRPTVLGVVVAVLCGTAVAALADPPTTAPLAATRLVAPPPPAVAAPAVHVERDLVYATGDGPDRQLDLAMPAEGDGPFPAVVFVHGGGWTGGGRQGHAGSCVRAAKAGYVAVTITYRLAPAFRFPAQVEDAKAAVRWLRANAKRYKVDADHIGAAGESAGGHLVSLLGTTSGTDKYEGTGGNAGVSSGVQAVVDYYGPSDLTRPGYSDAVRQACVVPLVGGTDADLYRAASPATYVTAAAPPFLILHGDADDVVPIDQSRFLLARLTAAGVPAELVVYPGDGHGFNPAHSLDAWHRTIAFFDAHLKRPAPAAVPAAAPSARTPR